MRKTRSDDRDQRAKYGTASVSSFNHGWRNYRFIFSIIFIFTTSPFALLRLRLSVASVHRSSSSSFLLLPVLSPSLSLHRVPRAMSLIFSLPGSPFFFSESSWSRFTSFSALATFLFLFDAVSSPLLPSSVSPSSSSSSSLHSALQLPMSRSFFLGLPASSCFFSFVITHGQYAGIAAKAAARRSGLNVPRRNWKRTW